MRNFLIDTDTASDDAVAIIMALAEPSVKSGATSIEFDDRDAAGELRFNAIGLVDGRVLFVAYTMRGDVIRIISARGTEPHEKRNGMVRFWTIVWLTS